MCSKALAAYSCLPLNSMKLHKFVSPITDKRQEERWGAIPQTQRIHFPLIDIAFFFFFFFANTPRILAMKANVLDEHTTSVMVARLG